MCNGTPSNALLSPSFRFSTNGCKGFTINHGFGGINVLNRWIVQLGLSLVKIRINKQIQPIFCLIMLVHQERDSFQTQERLVEKLDIPSIPVWKPWYYRGYLALLGVQRKLGPYIGTGQLWDLLN